MAVEIDPAVPGGNIILSSRGSVVDKRVVTDDGVVRFYDLAPGNYVANSVYAGQTGAGWTIVVTPTTYSVTRVSSPTVAGFVAFG